MGYAIIDKTTKYKGSRRIAHVTPKSPSGLINNTLTKVTFSYGNLVDNKFNISSVALQPAATTAPYLFELSAQRTGVSINPTTGEISLSSGFDGGTLTVIAKDSGGTEVGRYNIDGISPISTDVYSELQIVSFSYNKLAAYTANSTVSPTLSYSYKKNGVLHTITKSTDATDATVEYSKTNDPDPSYATVTPSTGVVKFTSQNDGNSNRSCSVTVTISLPGTQAETDSQDATQTYYIAPVIQPEITINQTSSGITANAGTSNTYNVSTQGAVGTLQVQAVSGDTGHFSTTFSNNILTITTEDDNTSGADYVAVFRVGDGTYYQVITVTQPFKVYYIDSITYPNAPVETALNSGIFRQAPLITNNEGTTYTSLADYNAVPGAQQYTLSGARSHPSSTQFAANKGIYADETTGDIVFKKSEIFGLVTRVTINLNFTNTSDNTRSITKEYSDKSVQSTIFGIDQISSEEWTTMETRECWGASSDTNDMSTTYIVSNSRYTDTYALNLGPVTKGDVLYLHIVGNSSDIGSSLFMVETNNIINDNATGSSKTTKRTYKRYLDNDSNIFNIVHVVANTCNELYLCITYWGSGPAPVQSVQYKMDIQ